MVVNATPLQTWQDYLAYWAVRGNAPYLSKEIDEKAFAKGQSYVTLLVDLDKSTVEAIAVRGVRPAPLELHVLHVGEAIRKYREGLASHDKAAAGNGSSATPRS